MMLPYQRALSGMAILSLAAVFAQPSSLIAQDDVDRLQLTIRIYSTAVASPRVLDWAAIEAARVLRRVPVPLSWVNCAAPAHSAVCESPETPTDLIICVRPTAYLEASRSALGMAMWSASGGSAALFYDRALTLRKPGLSPPVILGRAMAHEIVHLLLGPGSHSDLGLMRRLWSADDLRMDSGACLELSARAIESMHNEAVRRGLPRRESHDKDVSTETEISPYSKEKIPEAR